MTGVSSRLSEHILNIPLLFNTFSPEKLLHRAGPGKWSRKEILGHLIDSAINNLKRFTEIQGEEGIYVIRPYPQDLLVTANHYQEASLAHLLLLWQSLNRQIVYVIENIPPATLDYLVDVNPKKQELKTLKWLIEDYVVHMEHHLSQIVR
jgi:DinB superfamily